MNFESTGIYKFACNIMFRDIWPQQILLGNHSGKSNKNHIWSTKYPTTLTVFENET